MQTRFDDILKICIMMNLTNRFNVRISRFFFSNFFLLIKSEISDFFNGIFSTRAYDLLLNASTLIGSLDKGSHRVRHRREHTSRAFFVDPLQARKRRVRHRPASKTNERPSY